MGFAITPFVAAEATRQELEESYQAFVSAYLDFPDRPAPDREAVRQRLSSSASLLGPQRFWVARDGGSAGRIVGIAGLILPEHENTELTVTDVRVVAGSRRQGVGTALLRATLPASRAASRTVVTGQGLKSGGAGEKWAQALGFAKVQEFVLQRLVLAEVDPGVWNVPCPPGFALRHWTGAAPEDVVASYADARTAISDAPTGESSLRFPSWTVERVRQHEAEIREQGQEQQVVVVVETASGRVAGLTEMLFLPERPTLGVQQETSVLPAFRGHGLGRTVKADMMRRIVAERPGIDLVLTNTAADNVHMIRVNHQLGYLTDYTVLDVEADLDRLYQV